MRPDFWFGVAIMVCGLAIMAYASLPKKEEPKEVMTLLAWGLPGKGVSSQQWVYGALSQEEALGWRVWQPPGFELKQRIVIEGHPLPQ